MRTIATCFLIVYIKSGNIQINDSSAWFLAVVLLLSIVMDITEFIKKMIK
jgi:hypothetical protein